MTYYIYKITCGQAIYIGSTNNPQRRLAKHKKDLKEGTHSNDILVREYRRKGRLKFTILTKFETMFKRQVLLKEQRYINCYSNCNEGRASKHTHYTKQEFLMDVADFIKNNWKLLVMVLFVILVVGYGMTTEQAFSFINQGISFYQSLGG